MDFAEGLVRLGGRDVGAGGIGNRKPGVFFAFDRQPGSLPVGNPRRVIEDLIKSEMLEPTRGSRRQVSQSLVSVDHHRLVSRQDGRGVEVESSEWNIDGTGDVLRGVLALGEHIDNLATVFDEFQQPGPINVRHHRAQPSPMAVRS